MKSKFLLVLAALTVTSVTPGQASPFLEEFKDNYELLKIDLLDQPVEVAEISNFVYQKDIATFSFKSGKIFLARDILGRPTTALFIGKGHADIEVPSHLERQSLWFASGDSVVNEDFGICLIRMSDNLDLRLREEFTFTKTSLDWKNYNKLAKAQGEYFFDPQVMHKYDNYFQLMRSAYQRADDGYFWIDFNRYVFTFDPARPEQTIVSYEYEGGDEAVTEGARLQRKETGVSDDIRMSDIAYPVTILSQRVRLSLDGEKGDLLRGADARIKIRINRDSLRVFSLFLHSNLNVDSIYYDRRPADYKRRGSFGHLGMILPEYSHLGDTVDLRLWYHGKDYTSALVFAADPSAAQTEITFSVPSGYNYLVPAAGESKSVGKRRVQFVVSPAEPYRIFQFESMATGYDTIPLSGANGLPINILKSRHINKKNFENFIPDNHYRSACVAAVDFFALRLGPPLATDELYIYPGPEKSVSMPGLLEIPQVQLLLNRTGGLEMVAAKEAARQWFGALAQPATDREYWLLDALPDYLSLLFVRQQTGHGVFFGELGSRRDAVYTSVENGEDMPLATGERMSATQRTAKGAWVLHMLRSLMYDLEKSSDRPFWKFVRDLIGLINNQKFTNADFIALAEKHYGEPLDWFFHHWLYARNIPEFKVEYKIEKRGSEYLIAGTVDTRGVTLDHSTPVVMRVLMKNDQSSIFRQNLEMNDSFEFGPFSEEPKELIFNELYSVLCKQKVKKK